MAVFGFPLTGFLATGGNFTTGNIVALAGLGDDSRHFQISAPVQPGNSGGPLIDSSANVIGVVVSKMNALRVAVVTNDIPQNINFAIKSATLASFLDAKQASYEASPATRWRIGRGIFRCWSFAADPDSSGRCRKNGTATPA